MNHIAPQFVPSFQRVEDAIDRHMAFSRSVGGGLSTAEARVSREGVTMIIRVMVTGKRKFREVSGYGTTPQDAATALIGSLDHWQEAFR